MMNVSRVVFSLVMVIAFVICVPGAHGTELNQLVQEVDQAVSSAVLADLALPEKILLPSDRTHRAEFYWDYEKSDLPGGGLALIVPAGVRVGRELLRLQSEQIPFTSQQQLSD